MTDDERMTRIESRQDRLESNVAEELKEIRQLLAKLAESNVKPTVELENLIAAHNSTMLRVERLELQIMKLLQERAYVLGGCAAVSSLFSLLGVGIGMVLTWVVNKP